ncbi:MAG: hypothetical protein GZ091_11975 [Paludibacter sp.]|nr:hypothetical protein [Paludibacter sp.]
MKPIIFAFTVMLVMLTSCGKQSSDYKELKAQNDSLLNEKLKLQEEVDGYFTSMNEIEENIEKIKSAENILSSQPAGKELSDDVRLKINEDMAYLSEMIKTNNEELERLKSRLKKSGFKSTELERTILRLTNSLKEESTKVVALHAELAQRDSLIAQLGSTVNDLGKNVEVLTTDVKAKETTIKEQDDAIHTAWYVFGTRKELKEQKIITSDGLFAGQKVLQRDFNKNYFVRIDARNTKSIALFSTKAKILTNHPKPSYTLEKENGNFVLLIVNPSDFWSISKYLVIEVD